MNRFNTSIFVNFTAWFIFLLVFVFNVIDFLNLLLISNIHLILFLSREVFAFYKYVISRFLKKIVIDLSQFFITRELESRSTWVWRIYILKNIEMFIFTYFMIMLIITFICFSVSIWIKLECIYSLILIFNFTIIRSETYLIIFILNLSKR